MTAFIEVRPIGSEEIVALNVDRIVKIEPLEATLVVICYDGVESMGFVRTAESYDRIVWKIRTTGNRVQP